MKKNGHGIHRLHDFFQKSEIKEKNLIQKKMTKIIPFFLFLIEKLYICRLKFEREEINY